MTVGKDDSGLSLKLMVVPLTGLERREGLEGTVWF